MNSAQAKTPTDIDVDLHPHAVIVCNDLERFSTFVALLEKTGYPCRVVQSFPDGAPPAGTVHFVSFNLHSSNAIFLAKKIEQMGMACIVFAEDAGVQTAAKLSSAKMTQTLQYPYTEKNFVMAVQTIVKNRKAQFDKEQRKKQHEERLKSQQKASGSAKDAGIIIQEAPRKIIDDSAKVFKGETSRTLSIMQIGKSARGFFAIQGSPKPKSSRAATVELAVKREKKTLDESETLDYGKMKSEKSTARAAEKSSLSEQPKLVEAIAIHPAELEYESASDANPPAYERPMSHFWAVLFMCLLGSAICIYCVYQILFA